jgi:hypothetical protein
MWRESEPALGLHCSGAQPIAPDFLFIPKLSRVCKLGKAILYFSKIYQTLQYDRMKDKEQPIFWKKVQITNKM